MISFLRDCTDETPDTGATLARVVDHVLHAGERIGYEHVGIGSDFDGMMKGPDGLEDVSKFPALVADLLRRLPKDAVRNILGRNILRIMEEVERVSKHMKLEKNPPLCDKIEPIWGDDIRKQVIDIRLR
jgi:membrane dipeptidase